MVFIRDKHRCAGFPDTATSVSVVAGVIQGTKNMLDCERETAHADRQVERENCNFSVFFSFKDLKTLVILEIVEPATSLKTFHRKDVPER